jgi:predicted secreted protein
MSILSALAIYFVIWWTVLFVVLPFGVRRPDDDEVIPGNDPGAPVAARLGLKLFWNSVLSAVIFAIFVVVYRSGVITIDKMAEWMRLPF